MTNRPGFFETLQQLNIDLARWIAVLEAVSKENEHLRGFEMFARETFVKLQASVDAAVTKIDTVYKTGKTRDQAAEKAVENIKSEFSKSIENFKVELTKKFDKDSGEANEAAIDALTTLMEEKLDVEEFNALKKDLGEEKKWHRSVLLGLLAVGAPIAYDLIKGWVTGTG